MLTGQYRFLRTFASSTSRQSTFSGWARLLACRPAPIRISCSSAALARTGGLKPHGACVSTSRAVVSQHLVPKISQEVGLNVVGALCSCGQAVKLVRFDIALFQEHLVVLRGLLVMLDALSTVPAKLSLESEYMVPQVVRVTGNLLAKPFYFVTNG